MKIGQISVPYETLHAATAIFPWKTWKVEIVQSPVALMVHAVYRFVFPREPDNWKSSGNKTISQPF